ncbi:hypothetical protein [Paenibacillus senegalimassiliensis]|uniref:hypothetical protein n=1 Tax=Paenibacillus senegalimassiliensis TaxID=1737426 RepID=UPI00073E3E19|nr:hypothetical protein [Paenibacillus senegalimassiliensis]
MRIAAFCDFYGEASRPLQLIIRGAAGEMDWSKPVYIPVAAPFEPFTAEDFGDLYGVSVLLEDLLICEYEEPPEYTDGSAELSMSHSNAEVYIGIDLPQIAARCANSEDIRFLAVQMDDVEEVLNYRRR